MPFVLGLLLLILQVGVLVSDQVKLEHFAYEGAQWAIANRTAATVDPSGAAGTGTIAQHIYGLMCGGAGVTPPSSAGTRLCKAQPSGVPSLKISVVSQGTPTSLASPRVAPTSQVMGTSTCKLYSLAVSPLSVVINQSAYPTSATFTVTDTSAGGAGSDPTVSLNVTGFPSGLQVPPVFVPSLITAGQSATTTLQAGASTPPGTYTLNFNATDNCTGITSSTGPAIATLTVLGLTPSPTATPAATIGITGILPGLICVNVTSPITINGFGFQAGATVTTGPLSALSVTVVSSTQININTAALVAGIYNIVVTLPNGATSTLNSGLSVSTSCGGGTGCFSGTSGTPSSATVIDLTASWTTNQWAGATVTMGASTATVVSNTSTTLTFSAWVGGTPTAGAYSVCPSASGGGWTGGTPSSGTYTVTCGGGCNDSATSGAPTATTLIDTSKGWSSNEWVGATVTMSASTATVTSNNATTLFFTGGWTGGTPAAGAYTVKSSASDTGTTSSPPTATTLTDSTKAWNTSQWIGATVTRGGSTATVTSNNGTTLTFSGVAPPPPSPPPGGSSFSGLVGTPGPTTLTDLTASWVTNQWVGATVTMGGSTATVLSNAGTTLTFSGWLGGTPLPGPYTVQLAGSSGAATNACANAAGSYQTIITITWYEPLVIPMFAPSGTGTPYFTLRAVQLAFCQ